MAALSEEIRSRAEALIARYPQPRSALLPMLYLVQAEQGYVAGGRHLYERAREVVGAGSDEQVTVEEVECLAACDAAPVVQVNYCNYDRVSEERLLEMLDRLRADDPPDPSRGPRPEPHDRTARILAGLGESRGVARQGNEGVAMGNERSPRSVGEGDG